MGYTLGEIERGYCHIEDGPTYECYFPKTRQYWNGWAVPVGLTAKSLVDFVGESLKGQQTEYDYALCVEILTSIRPHQYGDLTLYGVGDGLIWTECDEEGEEK
tara:strand:- start:1948 stop:2256 length:309 start_codon:yes stop_codon:yes gene_type:complete